MKISKPIQIVFYTICCMSLLVVFSYQKSPKNRLSDLQLENINALTEGVESYKVQPCYKDVIFDDNSKHDITKCVSETTKTKVFNCSDGETKKGYMESQIATTYSCIQ